MYFHLYNPLRSIATWLITLFIIIILTSLTIDFFKPRQPFPMPPGMAMNPANMNPEDLKRLLDGMQGQNKPNSQNPNTPPQNPEQSLSENSPLSDQILKNLK